MHQTFYIDVDEEITSIVEKIRKAQFPEIIMVVPKHALLIQSIVNLKLLRKEADALGMKISIVTQDKLGKLLIAKAGISIQQKLENDVSNSGVDMKNEYDQIAVNTKDQFLDKNNRRLDELGSEEYFNYNREENIQTELEKFEKKEKNPQIAESRTAVVNNSNSFSGTDPNVELSFLRKKNISNMDVAIPRKAMTDFSSKKQEVIEEETAHVSKRYDNQIVQDFPEKKRNISRDKQLETFFYANNFSDKRLQNFPDDKKEKKGGWKIGTRIFISVLVIMFLGGLVYGIYFFLPKATITLSIKKEVNSTNMNVIADTNQNSVDYEKSIIPAKIVNFDDTISKTFDATGAKNVSDQKARGKITIYNEFSSSSQPLVATTRFLSDDQKIFRLVRSIVVPGMTKIGTEIKPGVVEADVIADESGDAYNIGPNSFSIPGFKASNSEKYAKIYAKSVLAMSGGGSGGSTKKTVTAKDISDAKDKISLDITKEIKQKIQDSAGIDQVVLDKAILLEDPIYNVSASVGDVTDNFEIKIQAKAKAIVFSESDMKVEAGMAIAKLANKKVNLDNSTLFLDYGQVTADFNLNTLVISTQAKSVVQPNIDLETLKKGSLGKNTAELADYFKSYPDIEKAEVEYWPPIFVNRVSKYEKKVDIIADYVTP